jgi:hypothetical protein
MLAEHLYRFAELDKYPAHAQGSGKVCMAGEPSANITFDDGSEDLDREGDPHDPPRHNLQKLGFNNREDTTHAWRISSWEEFARLFIGR